MRVESCTYKGRLMKALPAFRISCKVGDARNIFHGNFQQMVFIKITAMNLEHSLKLCFLKWLLKTSFWTCFAEGLYQMLLYNKWTNLDSFILGICQSRPKDCGELIQSNSEDSRKKTSHQRHQQQTGERVSWDELRVREATLQKHLDFTLIWNHIFWHLKPSLQRLQSFNIL